eukprot:1146997-Pelagomonas_calceolata.AAC.2
MKAHLNASMLGCSRVRGRIVLMCTLHFRKAPHTPWPSIVCMPFSVNARLHNKGCILGHANSTIYICVEVHPHGHSFAAKQCFLKCGSKGDNQRPGQMSLACRRPYLLGCTAALGKIVAVHMHKEKFLVISANEEISISGSGPHLMCT